MLSSLIDLIKHYIIAPPINLTIQIARLSITIVNYAIFALSKLLYLSLNLTLLSPLHLTYEVIKLNIRNPLAYVVEEFQVNKAKDNLKLLVLFSRVVQLNLVLASVVSLIVIAVIKLLFVLTDTRDSVNSEQKVAQLDSQIEDILKKEEEAVKEEDEQQQREEIPTLHSRSHLRSHLRTSIDQEQENYTISEVYKSAFDPIQEEEEEEIDVILKNNRLVSDSTTREHTMLGDKIFTVNKRVSSINSLEQGHVDDDQLEGEAKKDIYPEY